jgi:TP901 family phage tail tape measure protein
VGKQPSLFVSIGLAGLAAFDKDLRSAQKYLARTSRDLKSIGKDFTILAAPVAGLGYAAFRAAQDFEKGFKPVKMLLGENKARIEELRQATIALGPELGRMPAELSAGMADVIQTFGDSADSVERLRLASKLAEVGQTDLAGAIGYTDSILDAYNENSLAAMQRTADLAAAAVGLKVKFSEISAPMTANAAIARELGVSQADLMAQVIVLTESMGGAEIAGAALKGVYAQLIKPSKQLEAAIRGAGFESAQAMISQRGFAEAIKLVAAAAGDEGKGFDDVFKKAGSVVAVMKLAGEQSDYYRETLDKLIQSQGQLQKSWEALGGFGRIWTQIRAQIAAALIPIGEELLKVLPGVLAGLKPLLDLVISLTKWFANLSEPTKKWVLGLGAALALSGPTLIYLGSMAGSLRAIAGLASLATVNYARMIAVSQGAALGRAGMAGAALGTVGIIGLTVGQAILQATAMRSQIREGLAGSEKLSVALRGQLLLFRQMERLNWFGLDFGPWRYIRDRIEDIEKLTRGGGELDRTLAQLGAWKLGIEPKIDLSGLGAQISRTAAALGLPMEATLDRLIEKTDKLGDELIRTVANLAVTGDRISPSTERALAGFADLEEQVKSLRQQGALLSAAMPESAEQIEAGIKRVDAALEAARPYFERYAANFGRIAVAGVTQLGLIADRMKADYEKVDSLFAGKRLGQLPGFEIKIDTRVTGQIADASKLVSDFARGMRDAFQASVDEMAGGLSARFDDMLDMVRSWRRGFSDAIAEALKTGRWEFKSFIDQVIADIARLLAEVYIVQPIFQAFASLLRGLTGGYGGGGAIVGEGVGAHWNAGGYGAVPKVSGLSMAAAAPADFSVTVIDQRTAASSAPIEVKQGGPDGRTLQVLVRDAMKHEVNRGGLDKDFWRNFNVRRTPLR